MANCNDLFRKYNSAIRLSDDNRAILRQARNELRDRIKANYYALPEDERGNHELDFVGQGSYVMDTIITPWDEDFDLDDGIYFKGTLERNQRPEPDVFHDWIIRAVNDDSSYKKVSDKDTCVRVRYNVGFHIDLPIYYAVDYRSPDLAHKKKGWHLSNPIEFIGWFENKVGSGFQEDFFYRRAELLEEYKSWAEDIRKTDAQLRRIVRYMKGWGDHKRGDMPPGIVMTVLAGENYIEEDINRDDIALHDTLVRSRDWLIANDLRCPKPTTPEGEDLFEGYDEARKKYFVTALDEIIEAANAATRNPNEKEACELWQNHFGTRLPCELAKDEKSYVALASGAAKSDKWCKM